MRERVFDDTIRKNIIDEVITKILDEKCHKPKYFTRKNREIFDKFQNETQNNTTEQILILDQDGNTIFENTGEVDNVSVPDRPIVKYVVGPHSDDDRFNELDVDHNHPTIKGFESVPPILSLPDVNKMTSTINLSFPFRSITAESNGMRMSLIRQYNPKYSGKTRDDEYIDRMEEKIRTTNRHYWNAIGEYVTTYKEKLHEYTNIPTKDLKEYFTNDVDENTRKEISSRAVSEVGDLYSFLDKKGIIKEYHDCDIELLIES